MVGASLRNTLARRNHKERAQPLHRKRLGILEKHKDYVQRAKDYNSKQARIQKLREKAAFRNKDEFYFGMVKGRTEGGVAVGDRGNKALDHELVRLLKTQDGGYLRMQIAKDENRIAKIKAELEVSAPEASGSGWDASAELAEVEKLASQGVVLHRQPSSRKGKGKEVGHLIFADGVDGNVVADSGEPIAEEDELAEALDLGWEEPRKKVLKPRKSNAPTEEELAEAEQEARERRLELLTNLSALLNRVKVLHQAASKLEITKAHMGTKGGTARKVREAKWVEDETQEEDKNGDRRRWEGKIWKWKMERRR